MKNMVKKNVTIEDLAIMVQKEFNSVQKEFSSVQKGFDSVGKRFDRLE